jgi:hypothetical protein
MSRPWRVFVLDVGPTYTFATEDAAKARAEALVGPEFVLNGKLVGGWGDVLVYDALAFPLVQTRYRPGQPPVTERMVEGRWVS